MITRSDAGYRPQEDTDMSKKLIYKVLAIIGITLAVGFAAMGVLAIWLEYTATMKLQTGNSHRLAATVTSGITEFMMEGEQKKVAPYMDAIKKKQTVLDLALFSADGTPVDGSDASLAPLATQALKNGDVISIHVEGPLSVTFNRTHVRVHPSFRMNIHLDVDEGNACGLPRGGKCRIVKIERSGDVEWSDPELMTSVVA